MADTKKVDVEVRTPHNPVVINTAEDAAMAFLRGQISEDELKDAAASFGVQPGELMLAPDRLERPDDAFENTLPDDIYKPSRENVPDYKERLDAANEKQKERDAASKKTSEALTAGASDAGKTGSKDK